MMPMARPRTTTRHQPQPRINIADIRNHLITAQAAACRNCGPDTAILAADIALLLAEISRLHQSFIRSRRRAANYEAAIRAAIGAQEDGDHDPIGYLRDELTPDPGAAYGA
jgi:hypothetical protein